MKKLFGRRFFGLRRIELLDEILGFRFPIFDYREKQMPKKFRIRCGFSFSDDLKSKIQNRKWAGLLAIMLVLLFGGAGAESQQPTKVP
ncbi:MAG TPA: hypothetical protein VFS68_00875, partial [Candidatus Udaeobacter sp.]|nr:hypothetical protein [Candidatus Udaeobacter sp.]